MQQEGLVVAGLLASHSPTKATPVPAPPIRLTLQHWGVNIGQHSWDLSGARTAESLHEDAATSRRRGAGDQIEQERGKDCARDGKVQHERRKDCARGADTMASDFGRWLASAAWYLCQAEL
jgi:hypothetical protein